MSVDQLLQYLGGRIYEEPLSRVRDEGNYPNLRNPLHIAILLIDCDTEISMNGMLGFLENLTGQHLGKTVDALDLIGANKSAEILRSVRKCMHSHAVTWERLRGDFEDLEEYEITSFSELHGDSLDSFADEICDRFSRFDLFNTLYSVEDAYSLLVRYLEPLSDQLDDEIKNREA